MSQQVQNDSLRLAVVFYKLLDLPLSAPDKEEKVQQWAKELAPLFKSRPYEELRDMLRWALKEDPTVFWPERLYVPKNIINNIGTIATQYKTAQKVAVKIAQKDNPDAKCTCPRTKGEINVDEEGGLLYDKACPNHGKMQYYTYHIDTARGLTTYTPPVKPPRFGEPNFPAHYKAMVKVLAKAKRRKSDSEKVPVLPKNLDLTKLEQ